MKNEKRKSLLNYSGSSDISSLEKSLPSENELSLTPVTITITILQVLGNVINPH